MRSLALTLVSTLLLSPITVLSTYHHDEEHHWHPSNNEDHHTNNHNHLSYHEDDDKSHDLKYAGHSDKHAPHSKHGREIHIAIKIEVDETNEQKKCRYQKELCHGDGVCEKKIKGCHENKKCKKPKKACHRGHSCSAEFKTCKSIDESKYGLRCGKKFFKYSKIRKAAKLACSELWENKQKSAFPSLHTATQYKVDGPYYEWPIYRTGGWFNFRGKNKNRIVMTEDCKVVGGVIRNKDASYSKCHYGPK